MEHQVFVPVSADDLRAALRDPARLARSVPGLQQDADAASGPLAGRLRIRVGGHTVTYRGALTVTEHGPDRFAVAGEGVEVRGHGAVEVSLDVRLTPVDGGTRLDLTAGGAADGRAEAFTPEATATAVRRLLDRTAGHLAVADADDTAGGDGGGTAGAVGPAAVSSGAARPEPGSEPEPGSRPGAGSAPGSQDPLAEDADPVAEGEGEEAAGGGAGAGDGDMGGDEGADVTEVTASVFETEVPPPTLDPFLAGGFDAVDGGPRPPAEAAHARRTMIGRSAEEVDHAPPRGRYAPVPAPGAGTAGDSLRWLAPAAALAVASAVVLGRALRRRR
ncbi:SRPBCC family protein [Streptomyces subrutilus]|uniref:SRPBCC family protein n=1 Tax=Streptomyces subrutilus TaxID=36818 RepID=UPI002E164718|nr:SRPBCC family protein [Streptomyces subrutilus]